MIHRRKITYRGDEIIEDEMLEVTWDFVRSKRDEELSRTDFWALKDLTMSQEKKDYRIFLRDLPQNFETANDAADAWAAYAVPE